jgi:hypothetical protein
MRKIVTIIFYDRYNHIWKPGLKLLHATIDNPEDMSSGLSMMQPGRYKTRAGKRANK